MTEEFRMVPAGRQAYWFLGFLGLVCSALIALFGYTAYSCRHVEYHVSRDALRIRGLYGRAIPTSALRVEEAQRIDFDREPGLRPVARTNGVGLPGFLAGWVRLKNGSKALVYLTDTRRVVVVPTRDDYALLLSVTDPNGLLAALRQQAGTSAAEAPAQVFHMVPASGAAVAFCVGMSLIMVLLLALTAYLAWSLSQARFQVGAFGLRIRGLYGRTIPATSLVVAEARTILLRAEHGLRPSLRTNGAGLPGFLSGWMRLKNRNKALVFLTDWDRVVYVPTREGYTLLLSVDDPTAFIDSLRKHAA